MLCKLTGDVKRLCGDRREVLGSLVMAVALVVFLVIEVHAISLGNFAGQDYHRHCEAMRKSADHPWKTFTAPWKREEASGGFVSLYHIIGGVFYKTCGEGRAWTAVAVWNLFLNAFAFLLIWGLLRRLLASLAMRMAAFVFLLFLPLNVVTSVVVASDALSSFLLIAMVWLLTRTAECLSAGRSAMRFLIMLALVLVSAALNKVPYAVCLAGTLAVLLIFWRYGWISGKKLWTVLLAGFVLPLVLTVVVESFYLHGKKGVLQSRDKFPEWARLDYRKMFWFGSNDPEILDAPYFYQPEFVRYKIQAKAQTTNYFSYPALLHLGTYTDLLNMYQPIVYPSDAPWVEDEYQTRERPETNQQKMRLAVKTALVFTAGVIWSFFFWLVRSARNIWKKENPEDIPVFIILALTVPLFLGMILTIPLIEWAAYQGAWLPRHIFAVLVLFCLMMFVAIDRKIMGQHPWFRWVVLVAAVFQSTLHVSFLWP